MVSSITTDEVKIMQCEFSETQFLFGILHEITNKLNPANGWTAPIIPTQVDEKNLGYDCKLQSKLRTIFFQFKVPEKLTRNNAKYWSEFNDEYYLFKIWPDSLTPQHNKLVDLANKDVRYNVFYCSPAFIKDSEYSDFYEKGEIAKNSIYVSCKNLYKINGDDKHDISYTIDPRKAIMHSDNPQPLRSLGYEEFVKAVKDSKPYSNLEECVHELSKEFEIQFSCNQSTQEQLQVIANELLVKRDIHLLLF